MKKVILFIIIFLNIFSLSASAKIAYIDINLILKTSDVGKFLNSHIEKKKSEYLIKHKKIEQELIQKEKNLLSQKNIISEKDFDEKYNILSQEVTNYRKKKKLNINDLNDFKIENTKKILEVLNPIITNFVNLNSISIVIPKKNIIVGKKNLDITDQILKLLNKNINKLNF